MSGDGRTVALLGRDAAGGLEAVLRDLGIEGPVCTITAGQQEGEGQPGPQALGLERPAVDLALHARAEALFDRDPELRAAHRERQDRVVRMERGYRTRLESMAQAARALLAEEHRGASDGMHARGAVADLRRLDREHLAHLREAHGWSALNAHPLVVREREAIAHALEGAAAVLVAGGHAAVLVNRLRLFDVGAMLEDRAVVAWGAGAMACGARMVLFHDRAPQGPRDPEVLDDGLDLAARTIALPGAGARLDGDDAIRLELFARRFAPARCIGLDGTARLVLEDGRTVDASGALRVSETGRMTRVRRS